MHTIASCIISPTLVATNIPEEGRRGDEVRPDVGESEDDEMHKVADSTGSDGGPRSSNSIFSVRVDRGRSGEVALLGAVYVFCSISVAIGGI